MHHASCAVTCFETVGAVPSARGSHVAGPLASPLDRPYMYGKWCMLHQLLVYRSMMAVFKLNNSMIILRGFTWIYDEKCRMECVWDGVLKIGMTIVICQNGSPFGIKFSFHSIGL
jgi:hypothetical protein